AVLANRMPAAAQVGRLHDALFAVVLPDVSEEQARRLAVKLRDHVTGELVDVETDPQRQYAFRLTVAVGGAGQTEARWTLTALLAAADAALEEAKARGGGRVSVAPGDHRGAGSGVARAPAG